MPGTSAAVCILPNQQTGIVVLQSSLGSCDASEWICQLVMDVLFTGNAQNDYLALARESSESGAETMQKVQDELESHRIPVTRPHALIAYTEQYWSSTRNWVIGVLLDFRNQRLKMKLQARDDEEYCLRHYHNDIFV